MKYPLCEKMGLKVTEINQLVHTCNASEVEKLLSEGVVVYGNKFHILNDQESVAFALYDDDASTHSGLLIGYKLIEKPKPVSKEEIRNTIAEIANPAKLEKLLQRILENGVLDE